MKKISAVLLVMVLVGSVAFAGFTGNVETEFGINLDTKDYGFTNGESVTVNLNLLEAVGAAKGEGDIYADISAALNFTFDNSDAGFVRSADRFILDLEFVHAKIVGPNWHVGIYESLSAPNYATSTIDSDEFGDGTNDLGYANPDVVYFADVQPEAFVSNGQGVSFGYNGFTASFGAEGNFDTPSYLYSGSLETPAFTVAEGLTVQLGGSGSMSQDFKTGETAWVQDAVEYRVVADEATAQASGYDFYYNGTFWYTVVPVNADGDSFAEFVKSDILSSDKAISGSVKVAYASDMVSGHVAADLIYDHNATDKFKADVALQAMYDTFTLDMYYGAAKVFDNDYSAVTYKNHLSAMLSAELAPVTVTLTGKNLIHAQDMGLSVTFDATEELAVTAEGGYVISGTDKGDWNVGGDVAYTTDMFTAKAGGSVNQDTKIGVNASVESTTIIPGAELKLAYAGSDLTAADPKAAKDEDDGDKGSITASIKIAF